MATQIEREGAFIGKILQSSIGESTNGFPQWVVQLEAVKLWAESPDLLTHYQLTEPTWVDYTDETIIGYFVLVGKDGETLNFQQAEKAVGWDGTSFDGLQDDANVGKEVLFRVASRTYNDKTKLEVSWIDNKDASPTRTLKAVSSDKLKEFNAKFLTRKAPVKPASAAKPAAAPTKPTAAKAATPAPKAPPAAAESATAPAQASSAPSAASTPAPAKPGRPPKAKADATPAPAPAAPAASDVPAELSMNDAWALVNERKGQNDDKIVADAWSAASTEIAGDKPEEQVTPAVWSKIASVTLKDLAV
jgi:hypothetical protein